MSNADIDAIQYHLSKTTKSWSDMVTRYGSDPTKWPATTEWYKALSGLEALKTTTPVPVPTPTDPFDAFWAKTTMPTFDWKAPIEVFTEADLRSQLDKAVSGTRIQARRFKVTSRLAIRGKHDVWIDADPTLDMTAAKGVYGQGIWTVDCSNVCVTGFPKIHDCGNEALLDQGGKNNYFELDAFHNGGTGVLVNPNTGLPQGNIYKIKGGSNGLDLTLDPHAQKGTGMHMFNVWRQVGGAILIDIDDQPYGAGLESVGLDSVHMAVRAKTLSCDVNVLPPSPTGGRQAAGNIWQPWDAGSAPYPHVNCVIEALIAGECAQGVFGSLSSTENKGNVVKYGKVGHARLSPTWASLPGVSYAF